MYRLTASALAAAALFGSASATSVVDPLGCAAKSIDNCKDTKGCKWAKQIEFCYNKSLGSPESQTPAPLTPSPEPTAEPTEAPTFAPTESPTEEPTEAPVEPPTEEPESEEPEGPFEQANCAVLGTKSQCNRTPTCVFKVQEDRCAGCPDQTSRNSCDRVVGCVYRQKACQADDSVPHPDDDECAVHQTKRHCRNFEDVGCMWLRSNKCRGHRGCSVLRNNIDCRGASNCYWLPNKNECVELSSENN